MNPPFRRLAPALMSVLAVAVSATTAQAGPHAAEAAQAPCGSAVSCALSSAPVDDRSLEQQRGGFESRDGRVAISFGVQQSVYVDGQLRHEARLATVDGRLVVQLGDGNRLALGGATGPAAVVQNSTSGRQVQVLRVIDVTVDSLRQWRREAVQGQLLGGIVGSLQR